MDRDKILQELNLIENKTELDKSLIHHFKLKTPMNIEGGIDCRYGSCPECGGCVNDWDDYRVCRTCGTFLDWNV